MRLIDSVASTAWIVENTRCPVSAAESAVRTVSSSRISPIRITSGSWRSTRRSARAKEAVSMPTSRWLIAERLSWWTNSIGSSIVTMWRLRVSLMWSIIAASVVDLPEPVAPASRTMPRSSSASVRTAGGSRSSSIVLMRCGIARHTRDVVPRWRNALTRKRPTWSISNEKSTSFSRPYSSRRSPSGSSACSAPSVCSDFRISHSGTSTRVPSMRQRAGEPTFRCRSEPPCWTISQSTACTSNMLAISGPARGPLIDRSAAWTDRRRARRRRGASAPRRGSGASSATGSRSGGSARASR